MRIVVHIGTEKTGTSSLQEWLHANDATLIENGIFYSRCMDRPVNRGIMVYARDADRPDDNFILKGISTVEQHARFQAELEKALAVEMKKARQAGCTTYVISSEHLHSRLFTDEMIKRVHHLLAPHADKIEIVCLLRPQADVVLSRLSTEARNGTISYENLKVDRNDPYYNYLKLWKLWSGVFEHVHFLPFERNKDVIQCVCDLLGTAPELYKEIGRKNEKIDYRAAMFTHRLRLPMFADGIQNRNREIFLDEMPMEQPICLSEAQGREIQDKFTESNAELVAQCDTLEASDLELNLKRYPEKGNFDDIFLETPDQDFARYAVLRLNAQIWMERAQTNVAYVERALLNKNFANARQFKRTALSCLSNAAQAKLPSLENRIQQLRSKLQGFKIPEDT